LTVSQQDLFVPEPLVKHNHSLDTAGRAPTLEMSVPKILTLFIPEILSHPAIAGRDRTLSVAPGR
jgi:hypothetical protein